MHLLLILSLSLTYIYTHIVIELAALFIVSDPSSRIYIAGLRLYNTLTHTTPLPHSEHYLTLHRDLNFVPFLTEVLPALNQFTNPSPRANSLRKTPVQNLVL